MRLLAVLGVCLLVAACDIPVTPRPLLVAEPSAPRLRDGIWASQDYNQGPIDLAHPSASGDATSTFARVQGDTLTDLSGFQKAPQHFVLSAGTPILAQLSEDSFYYFAGVEVERHDELGRITALRLWPVYCGEPGKPDPKRWPQGAPTSRLFPGFVKIPRAVQGCTTRSPVALRAAADRSRAFAPASEIHWVRDR